MWHPYLHFVYTITGRCNMYTAYVSSALKSAIPKEASCRHAGTIEAGTDKARSGGYNLVSNHCIIQPDDPAQPQNPLSHVCAVRARSKEASVRMGCRKPPMARPGAAFSQGPVTLPRYHETLALCYTRVSATFLGCGGRFKHIFKGLESALVAVRCARSR